MVLANNCFITTDETRSTNSWACPRSSLSRAGEERVAGAQASANLGFVPGPAPPSCDKSRPLPEPQFPHLLRGDNRPTSKGYGDDEPKMRARDQRGSNPGYPRACCKALSVFHF